MAISKRQQQQRRSTLRPHPARDQIVDAMRSYGQPISPTRLAEVTGNTLGSVAYHVRTLLAAGVVELAEEGRVRGAVEHFYALVPDNEAEINDPLVGPAEALRRADAARGPERLPPARPAGRRGPRADAEAAGHDAPEGAAHHPRDRQARGQRRVVPARRRPALQRRVRSFRVVTHCSRRCAFGLLGPRAEKL